MSNLFWLKRKALWFGGKRGLAWEPCRRYVGKHGYHHQPQPPLHLELLIVWCLTCNRHYAKHFSHTTNLLKKYLSTNYVLETSEKNTGSYRLYCSVWGWSWRETEDHDEGNYWADHGKQLGFYCKSHGRPLMDG